MMTYRFYLPYAKKSRSAINLAVSYNAFVEIGGEIRKYKPVRIALPVMISTALWLPDAKRVHEIGVTAKDARVINGLLARVEAELKKYHNQCLDNAVGITEAGIREAIAVATGEIPASRKRTPLLDIVRRTQADSIAGLRQKAEGGNIGTNTMRQYVNCIMHLQKYEAKHGTIYTDELAAWGPKWNRFLDVSGVAINTKATINKKINASLNYGIQLGLIEKVEFRAKTTEITPDTIALTRDEVNRIVALDLSYEPLMEVVRDLFIAGVWTMLRFSDYGQISALSLTQDGMLKIMVSKTDRAPALYLPIHPHLKAILEKYNYKMPKIPALQVFNRNLKQICKLARIDKMEQVREYKYGVVKKRFVPRYQMVASHTARRTGATLLYLAGVQKKQIMMITGHSTEEQFDRYVKVSHLDNARKLAQLDVFKV